MASWSLPDLLSPISTDPEMSFKRNIATSTYPLRRGCVDLVKLKFGFLGKRNRSYRGLILESGLFDPHHYRTQFPRNIVAGVVPPPPLHPAWGEAGDATQRSFPNPDLSHRQSGCAGSKHSFPPALSDFREEREPTCVVPWTDPGDVSLSKIPTLRKSEIATRHRIAVVIHLFYHELWEEISGQPPDLALRPLRHSSHEGWLRGNTGSGETGFSDATAVPMPNHGRDILPALLNAGLV